MSDIMRPVSFKDLAVKILREQESSRTIFSYPLNHVYKSEEDSRTVSVFSQECASPVGPAAGPHTQLAQNIIVSYLAGGRFMELKTVQKLDELEIEKPCIYAADEGYNVEWSSEYTLEQSYDEYLKAWFILHLLESNSGRKTPSFIFNMSVGYDLEGIKTEKMQRFINSMINASQHPLFEQYSSIYWKAASALEMPEPMEVSPCVSPSVTLSTMHGCPPEEIEAICRYMITEKKLDTFVKLNPTLLGYDRVREMLDALGYEYLHLKRESFEHDLQYPDAVSMLKRLADEAESCGRGFGIKLSNTLGSVNDQGCLPGDEMYMSGRALYPLTVTLASELSQEFDGALPVSYSAGAASWNVGGLFDAGIHPITAATELLKPSGYLRLRDMVEACSDRKEGWTKQKVDVTALKALAAEAMEDPRYRKEYRGEHMVSVEKPLSRFDCYTAPCVAACPISQDVPEYLDFAGHGLFEESLEMICRKNPLPNIMGYICDHQCMYNCTRMHYEGAVQIRELKRIAAEAGREEYRRSLKKPQPLAVKAAVIGAGPAGLSAAYYLAMRGIGVTVFERESSAGGIVQHVIPDFRFPQKAIDADVSHIESLGVSFVFNADTETLDAASLQSQGFSYLLYAVGAEKNISLPLESCAGKVTDSLSFLRRFRRHEPVELGEHAVVVGGGNTAMDGARAAAAVPGVRSVTVVYRRTERQMPADLEEYDNALKDGVKFRFLANPVSLDGNALLCRVMKLGEPDESGRARPVETDETFTIPCDTLITAVGERTDVDLLRSYGLPVSDSGEVTTDEETLETSMEGVFLIGDAFSGPSTVVQSAASAMKACARIIEQELGSEENTAEEPEQPKEDLSEKLSVVEQYYYQEIADKRVGYSQSCRRGDLPDEQLAAHEAKRCLECSRLCNICVDVCPNRANAAVDVMSLKRFSNPYQIIHIDSYCNECGNCALFCPWEGKPYTDKFTVFSCMEDFQESSNSGFFIRQGTVHIRDGSSIITCGIEELAKTEADENLVVLINHILRNHKYLVDEKELERS